MPKLSRAKIAAYFADEIVAGKREIAKRLAAFLLDTGRTSELDLIVADIEYELSRRGIILSDVTTAHPVKNGLDTEVASLLKAKAGDRVLVRHHIDPGLIGGIKIRASGKELDASIRHKLNQFKATSAV